MNEILRALRAERSLLDHTISVLKYLERSSTRAEGFSATRICSRCGRRWPLLEFYRNGPTARYRYTFCRRCNAKRAREFYHRNRSRIQAHRRFLRARKPTRSERRRLQKTRTTIDRQRGPRSEVPSMVGLLVAQGGSAGIGRGAGTACRFSALRAERGAPGSMQSGIRI